MSQETIQILIDMGFEKEKVYVCYSLKELLICFNWILCYREKSVSMTGNLGVEPAMEW